MTERLQKIISSAGIMSRRAAEGFIAAGRVTLNGVPARLGDRADAEIDRILVDGQALPSTGEKIYIMLNKPRAGRPSRSAVTFLRPCSSFIVVT